MIPLVKFPKTKSVLPNRNKHTNFSQISETPPRPLSSSACTATSKAAEATPARNHSAVKQMENRVLQRIHVSRPISGITKMQFNKKFHRKRLLPLTLHPTKIPSSFFLSIMPDLRMARSHQMDVDAHQMASPPENLNSETERKRFSR